MRLGTQESMAAWLDQRLAGFASSPIPVWLMHFEPLSFLWANAAAVKLWRADNQAALLARDLTEVPQAVKQRNRAMYEKLSTGAQLTEEWTLYPGGVPTPVRLFLSGIALPDGQMAVLNQAITSELATDPTQLRGIEALRHTHVVVMLVEPTGTILMRNAAAHALLGAVERWDRLFSDRDVASQLLDQALAGEHIQRDLWAHTPSGPRCLRIGLHAVRDPVTGQWALLVHMTDETHHVETTDQLRESLALVESQRQQIVSLSAPLIDIREGVLVVPIIGIWNAERMADLSARLLPGVIERRARWVVFELSGALFDDGPSVLSLLRVLSAIGLLGCRAALCGLRPEMSQRIVKLGLSAQGIPTYRSLAVALTALSSPVLSPLSVGCATRR